jgi:ABC-type branched-subunit amino acid transport system substrate-binding protein/cytochrome c553
MIKARPNLSRARLVVAILLGAFALAMAGEKAVEPEKQSLAITRGRQIYLRGVPLDGSSLPASVGNPPMEVPASILKCVNCHGRDGRGQTEGGIAPANIRWEELTKPSGSAADGRRQRAAYSGKLLVRAIALGVDASGHKLDPAMPRYHLTHEQADDLVAYLEVLGREADPGVTETTLKVGVVLPPAGVTGSAQTIRGLLAAFAVQVNEQGGFYGRALTFSFFTAPDEIEARAGMIRDFVEREQPFLLLASYVAGCEDEIGHYLEENKVPSIGPIALYAKDKAPGQRYVFHLVAGLAGQGEALGRFAARLPELNHGAALVVRRQGDTELDAVKDGISKPLVNAGWSAPREVALSETFTPDWTALLDGGHVRAVFWFAAANGLDEFYRAATKSGSYPFLFAPGVLVGNKLQSAPPGFAGRIFCSFATLPSDQSSGGKTELLKLSGEAQVSDASFPRMALSSAKLLAQSLRQMGKELSREKLVETLETFYRYNTEQTPAVTFAPDRHVGADGAHVIGIDIEKKSLVLPPTWVQLH